MQRCGSRRARTSAILACLALACGVACGGALLALSERAALADEAGPPRFGDRGQLILSADRLLPLASYTRQSVTATQGDTTTTVTDSGTSIALFVGHEPSLGAVHTFPRLAIDFTVLNHLTLGTSVVFAFGLGGAHVEERAGSGAPRTTRETESPRSTLVGFAPRLGYVVQLGSSFALWPRAGFGFYSMSSKTEEASNQGVTSTSRVTDTVFSLDLDPQLVWLPLPHVLVYAGPLLNVPLNGSHETSFSQASDTKTRSDDLSVLHVGLSAGLGAWFDL
jgi:hypothetical protein